jgi:hypothetical protein
METGEEEEETPPPPLCPTDINSPNIEIFPGIIDTRGENQHHSKYNMT